MHSIAQHLLWFLPMLWLGMVLAISFPQAPLKFRPPGVTPALGLGIGRLVFRALNAVEIVPAVVLIAAAAVVRACTGAWIWLLVTVSFEHPVRSASDRARPHIRIAARVERWRVRQRSGGTAITLPA
jgi:hypothetical protein